MKTHHRTRMVVIAAALIGAAACGPRTVAPAPTAAPPPPPPPPEMPPPPPPVADQAINVCVLQDGNPADVSVMYNPATGDTTYNGQPFATAFPTGPAYAADATWYIGNEPVTFEGRRFMKYGLPRVLEASQAARIGEYQGVGVFAEPGASAESTRVLFLPVRPGCEFQPYQYEASAGAVRG